MNKSPLMINHVIADMSAGTGIDTDIYSITRDGEEVCQVRFDSIYNGVDEPSTSITVVPNEATSLIEGCMGPEHLIASVTMNILSHFEDSHDHYFDSFYDNGNGARVARELTILGVAS